MFALNAIVLHMLPLSLSLSHSPCIVRRSCGVVRRLIFSCRAIRKASLEWGFGDESLKSERAPREAEVCGHCCF